MQKQVYDGKTGQTVLVDMTTEEIAALSSVAIPNSCTRTQGLLALLYSGMADPVTTITTAINAIADPTQRAATLIRFKADTWYRNDLHAEAPLIGKTPDEIDALLVAAQAY